MKGPYFSGLVVCYNEATRLKACLESIAFCKELIVIDLGSTDDSREVARACGARVLRHERVPVVEMVLSWAVERLPRHDWVILLDPDEVFPSGIRADLERIIQSAPDLGWIELPTPYYFLGRRLTETRWGRVLPIPKVVHRRRIGFRDRVHRGKFVRDGYRRHSFPPHRRYWLKHYWVDTLYELVSKHRRYIREEGRGRFEAGVPFRWRACAKAAPKSLRLNLFNFGGWQSLEGWFLSAFHAWYELMIHLSLRRAHLRAGTGD